MILFLFILQVSAIIWQNEQVRITDYPNLQVAPIINDTSWSTYSPNASEISYKGRWDQYHISYWTAPGLKFGFQGSQVAIDFGNWTSQEVLIAVRVGGLDWTFTNVTANATYLLADSQTNSFDIDSLQTFELRVSNWDYGVQIRHVHVKGGSLSKVPDYARRMELIGDSLSAGQYRTLEGMSGYTWGLAYGFGQTEFSITAYPGMCVYDGPSDDGFCYGGGPRQRGQEHQWLKVSDNSQRAIALYGNNPPDWDFASHPPADLTLINLGANDVGNKVPAQAFVQAYIKLIDEVRSKWPQTEIIVLNLWDFQQANSTWTTLSPYDSLIQSVVRHYNNGQLPQYGNLGQEPSVRFFNTTGILQHNDIGPLFHPTDFGDVKLASHLMQFIKFTYGWDLDQTGPEVQHKTLYWNDEVNY